MVALSVLWDGRGGKRRGDERAWEGFHIPQSEKNDPRCMTPERLFPIFVLAGCFGQREVYSG